MKLTSTTFLLMLLSIPWAWSQTFMELRQELDQYRAYESLDEALKEPEMVYRLNLNELQLDEDKLDEALARFVNLRELQLSNTFISNIPASIGQLQNLQFLNIQHLEKQNPNLSALPESIQQLQALVSINLIGHPNLDWPNAFRILSKLPKLVNLAVMNSGIQKLPMEVTGLRALEMIWLGSNPDLNLEDTFSKLAKLTNLSQMGLGGNGHRRLPQEIAQLKNINNLWLSGNPWESLDGLQRLPNLSQLSLHNCNLKVFPKTITSCAALEYLSFVQNPGLDFDEVFEAIPASLRALNLSRNQIRSLPADQLKKTNLETLILKNNDISEGELENYQQLKKGLNIIF